ncbi:hypothetical protein [Saccharopolyspora shandongensis]|uniref:hypothetical protein n=1 Tax=Saccharopolyspora shandongensis TaxID=418495 RepID=UPI003F4D61C0
MADVLAFWQGILGAVVGGAAAATVAGMNIRAQRHSIEQKYRQRVLDVRREAYVAFVSWANRYSEAVRHVAESLTQNVPEEDKRFKDSKWYYDEARVELRKGGAAVQVLGPPNLAGLGAELEQAATDLGDVCDEWLRRRGQRPNEFAQLETTVDERIRRFTEAVREIFEPAQDRCAASSVPRTWWPSAARKAPRRSGS